MQYHSLKNPNHHVGFQEALIRGLAPDKGLYFPQSIPKLPKRFLKNIYDYEIHELAFKVIYPYIQNALKKEVIWKIIEKTLTFPFPLTAISENLYSLELFHGPTLAFKDVGSMFMAGCLGHFQKKNDNPITVLVATSGDTGGAVARGFYKVPKVKVVILYPSKKVSELQEKQLTTLGENIVALEIEGNFDDCQNLVKQAFLDESLQKKCFLTSANSINIARWLPQMFYYFIASTNSNDTVPRFMKSGVYLPKSAITTLSSAMDISDPSNFARILHLHPNLKDLKNRMSARSFTDFETVETMKKIWEDQEYMLDPHGAVAYLGLKEYIKDKNLGENTIGIFLQTAHPVKFIDRIPQELCNKIVIPNILKTLLKKDKKVQKLSNNYENFRDYLLNIS